MKWQGAPPWRSHPIGSRDSTFMHSYHHNIKTFNSATRHLTRVERALYRDLIELYYDTEQPLPAVDFDRLARRVMATTEDEKESLQYVLDEFFEITGDVYTHDYCDEQIEKFHAANTAKSRAGKASAEARREKSEARKRNRKAAVEQKSTGVEQVLNTRPTESQQNPTNHEPVTMNHEPVTNNPPNPPSGGEVDGDPKSDPVREVFDHWVATMGKKTGAKLSADRRRKIQARLREGYTVDQLKQAVDGCAASAYHMARDPTKNPDGTVYNDLELICRSGSKVENFIQKLNLQPMREAML